VTVKTIYPHNDPKMQSNNVEFFKIIKSFIICITIREIMPKRRKESNSGIIIDLDPWGTPKYGLTAQGYIARDWKGDGRKKNIRKNIRDEIGGW
jgi:hypothetical protein